MNGNIAAILSLFCMSSFIANSKQSIVLFDLAARQQLLSISILAQHFLNILNDVIGLRHYYKVNKMNHTE